MGMLHITAKPMTLSGFDDAIATLGWRRDGDEAVHLLDQRASIHGIEEMPAEDGEDACVMFESSSHQALDILLRAVPCHREGTPGFCALVGLPDLPQAA